MTLREDLAAFKANFEAGGPPYHAPDWIHEPRRRATAELVASGAADKALKAGDRAPAFVLRDADGEQVAAEALLARGLLVVSFYRGAWCPYCNIDLRALEAILPEYRALGAGLVAISPQTAANSRRSARENGLSFPILSDPGNAVAAAFGVRFALPDYLVALYRDTFKNDLAVVNGDASWTLPMPSRFVICPHGVILHAEVGPDYTQRPEPADLLPVLRKAASMAA